MLNFHFTDHFVGEPCRLVPSLHQRTVNRLPSGYLPPSDSAMSPGGPHPILPERLPRHTSSVDNVFLPHSYIVDLVTPCAVLRIRFPLLLP